MVWVIIRIFRLLESIYVGLKLIHGLKIQNAWHKLIIPHILAYEVFKSSNSVRIRSIQAEESKYEILIPFE